MCKETIAKSEQINRAEEKAAMKQAGKSRRKFSWTDWARYLQLPVCATGICVSYIYYGFFQERLFTNPSERLGPSFVLVTSCITNTVVAVIWQELSNLVTPSDSSDGKEPAANTSSSRPLGLNHPLLIMTAGCYVGAMTLSNEAIPLVSYPVAVLAKSCKLIPIMLVGQFVEHKLHSASEWFAAFLICFGIVLFQFSRMTDSHQSVSMNNQMAGMTLLLLSLLCDGLLSSCQNLLKRTSTRDGSPVSFQPPNAVQTMLFVNLYALLFLVPWTMVNGQMNEGLEQVWDASTKLLIINGCVGVGQIFIFLTCAWYTPVVTTIITTTRKFCTILISVRTFGHVFSGVQWTAIGMVFCGLYLSILGQQQRKNKSDSLKQKQS